MYNIGSRGLSISKNVNTLKGLETMRKLLFILILALFGCNGSPQTRQFWYDFNNNYQRHLDRQVYNQPYIIQGRRSNLPSNYWQEQAAQQQALEYWQKQQGTYGY